MIILMTSQFHFLCDLSITNAHIVPTYFKFNIYNYFKMLKIIIKRPRNNL